MILIIDGFQVLLDGVCIDLCGGNVAVVEHLLNGTKVCAVLQQDAAAKVPQSVCGVMSQSICAFSLEEGE